MLRDGRGRQPVFAQHAPNRIEPVERRRIEGRAHEAARVLGIADAARGQGQILELGEPAGDRRPLADSRAARGERRNLRPTSHICTRRRGRKRRASRGSAERAVERHERMIAVDHDPRTAGRASAARSSTRSKMRPLPNSTWLTRMKSCSPACARCQESVGQIVEWLGGDLVERDPPFLRPARELPPRAVELAVGGENPQRSGLAARRRGDQADEEIVRARREHDGVGHAAAELARDMALASGQTSPSTLSHLVSAKRAASFQAST